MPVYVVFGDVWEDGYGIDVHCFGVYTSPEKANEVLESLEKKKALRNGFVEEIIADKKMNIEVAKYIE